MDLGKSSCDLFVLLARPCDQEQGHESGRKRWRNSVRLLALAQLAVASSSRVVVQKPLTSPSTRSSTRDESVAHARCLSTSSRPPRTARDICCDRLWRMTDRWRLRACVDDREAALTRQDPNSDGRTALHIACAAGQADAAQALLDAGADPSAADNSGVTPLISAGA